MENYEQKYKEALETARKINSGEGVAAPKDWSIPEIIFPELRKSENERIKTNIIKLLRFIRDAHHQYFDECNEAIDWLEKQGEPINKEPKFKVDNFIVHNNSGDVCQVTEIKDEKYCIWPLYAEIEGFLDFIDVDNDYHLWTIQDAKDGDVLSTKKGNPFIYDKNRYNNGLAYYYAAIDANEELTLKNPHNMLSHFGELRSVFPATKEQRDFLFQKMKEAGYKWDNIKKELIRYE